MYDLKNCTGILLVNKPLGLTSNAVLQKVKRHFGIKKAGHTGSLDPLATGMLPLCFGEATKVCQYMLNADKCYQTTGLLGIKTDTSDAAGKIIAQCEQFIITKEQLESVLEKFKGPILQVPSMYSALKYQGRALYKLAREGLTIERSPREITIHDLQLNNFQDHKFKLTVMCSKGTYIRNLVEDIGDSLGVGAHVLELHRLYTAGFQNDLMYPLEELLEKTPEALSSCLLPMDRAIVHLPKILLQKEEVLWIQQGKRIIREPDSKISEYIRLYDEENTFIGIGIQLESGAIKAQRLMSYV